MYVTAVTLARFPQIKKNKTKLKDLQHNYCMVLISDALFCFVYIFTSSKSQYILQWIACHNQQVVLFFLSWQHTGNRWNPIGLGALQETTEGKRQEVNAYLKNQYTEKELG